MAYLLVLFMPETWLAFRESGAMIQVFGNGIGVWPVSEFVRETSPLLPNSPIAVVGVLEAASEPYFDESPIRDELDAFPVRCKVKPIVTLEPDSAVLIRDENVWKELAITN